MKLALLCRSREVPQVAHLAVDLGEVSLLRGRVLPLPLLQLSLLLPLLQLHLMTEEGLKEVEILHVLLLQRPGLGLPVLFPCLLRLHAPLLALPEFAESLLDPFVVLGQLLGLPKKFRDGLLKEKGFAPPRERALLSGVFALQDLDSTFGLTVAPLFTEVAQVLQLLPQRGVNLGPVTASLFEADYGAREVDGEVSEDLPHLGQLLKEPEPLEELHLLENHLSAGGGLVTLLRAEEGVHILEPEAFEVAKEVELVLQGRAEPHRLELLRHLLQLRAQGLELLRAVSEFGHALLNDLHFQEISFEGPVRRACEIGAQEVAQPAILPFGAEEVSEPVQALSLVRGCGLPSRKSG